MILIHRDQTNPYFNIAAEEYFLKSCAEDVFMLWQNEPSVIIGKHQNTLAEINYPYVTEHQIPVIRRISGGGAVFHDLGNINFTFVKTVLGEDLVDFSRFITPVIHVLQHLGVDARHEGHNDIRINGLKCSGNAEHVFKNRVLHHGTILYSSDLSTLGVALHSDEEKYSGRAVKSRRSLVTNLLTHLKTEIPIREFIDKVYDYQRSVYTDVHDYQLSLEDEASICELADQKYKSWEWNFGYSPGYRFSNQLNPFQCELEIRNGLITTASLLNQSTQMHYLLLEEKLQGVKHRDDEILKVLMDNPLGNHAPDPQDFLRLFF